MHPSNTKQIDTRNKMSINISLYILSQVRSDNKMTANTYHKIRFTPRLSELHQTKSQTYTQYDSVLPSSISICENSGYDPKKTSTPTHHTVLHPFYGRFCAASPTPHSRFCRSAEIRRMAANFNLLIYIYI